MTLAADTPPVVYAPRHRRTLIAAALAASLAGCYSHDSLITKARNKAIRTRIDEVDLGRYQVTMPRDQGNGELTQIEIHLFGETERYKINEIEEDLERFGPRFEDHTIRVLRELQRPILTDPELVGLRESLLTAFNEVLTGSPLKRIGFYDVRFIRH